MTTLSLLDALELYRQSPLDDGDTVLVLPGGAGCFELGPLPDPGATAALVQGAPGDVVLLAVARTGRRPRPDDLLLWAGLVRSLARSGRTLLPLEVLPAA